MRYLFIGYQFSKWSENFDINTIERVKKRIMFQRKMADFKGKQPESYKV